MRKNKTLPIKYYLPIYICVIALCVALDQLSKHAVFCLTGGSPLNEIPIIGQWMTLYWTTNDGATGGIFGGLGWQNWLFFVITLIGLPAFFVLLLRSRTRSVWGQVAFAFIIGGTIGNAIDRFRYGLTNGKFFGGEVRDFIKVDGFFGIFNIADSFLVVGVILALLSVIFFDPDSLVISIIEERRQKAQAVADGNGAEGEGGSDEND